MKLLKYACILILASLCNYILASEAEFFPPHTIYTLVPEGRLPDLSRPYVKKQALDYWLQIAVMQKNAAKAKEFLTQGADPNAEISHRGGRTYPSPLWVAVATEQVNLVKLLLDYGANPEKARPLMVYGDRPKKDIQDMYVPRFYLDKIPQEDRIIWQKDWPYGSSIFKLADAIGKQEIKQLLNDYASGKKKPTFKTTPPPAAAPAPKPAPQPAPQPKPQQPATPTPTQESKPQPKPQPTTSGKTEYQKTMSNQYAKFGDAKFWPMAYAGDLEGFQGAVELAKQKGIINNLYEIGVARGKMPALSAAILRKDPYPLAGQYLKIVEILLKAGANPNQPDENGDSPFLYAAYTDAPIEIFKALLEAGANAGIIDKNQNVPLINLIKDPGTKNLIQKYLPKQPSVGSDLTTALNQLTIELNSLEQGLN